MKSVKNIVVLFLVIVSCTKSSNDEFVTSGMIDFMGGKYEGGLKNGLPDGMGRLVMSDSTVFYGQWEKGKLHGEAVRSDTLGHVIKGYWDDFYPSDVYDVAYPNGTVYRGTLDSLMRPSGFGIMNCTDGTILKGKWVCGEIDGFGIGISAKRTADIGFWKSGRYQGERMMHSSDRVYGIDISRYQHNSPIKWKKLRIKSLGTRSEKFYRGERTDYPISFMYVKASQGLKIRNKYLAQDIKGGNSVGIPCGAYHFFTTADVEHQADNFLQSIKGLKLRMPPMLDMELTEDEIFEMGGPQVLFKRIRQWMDIVERRTGKCPLLYAGQTFVMEHLNHIPPILAKYDLWIARYGEFKPAVHIQFWQLGDDGRVQGISGTVDIDVFNGSRTRFTEYMNKQ